MLLPSSTVNGFRGSAVNVGCNSTKQKINVIQTLAKFDQRKLTDRESLLFAPREKIFSLNTSVVDTHLPHEKIQPSLATQKRRTAMKTLQLSSY